MAQEKFDLEERTLKYSKRILGLCRVLPKNKINLEIQDQLFRSASAVGANYREANDALGKKDFVMRIKIARKEAKEAEYWLELVAESNPELKDRLQEIRNETIELKKILSAIIQKVK